MKNPLDYADSTKDIYSGPQGYEAFLMQTDRFCPGRRVALVADGNTWKAAGEKLFRLYSEKGFDMAEPYLFPAEPLLKADYLHVALIKEYYESQGNAALVVAGSGTLNDLVKMAATELGIPYGVFCTAASVDGYASDGSPLLVDGFKVTLRSKAPLFIAADEAVLKAAPQALTSAGYADLAAKKCGGADWLLADLLDEEPVDAIAWQIVQSGLDKALTLPVDVSALLMGLNAAGFAMQYMKNSRPVSGAEHLFSHVWEMEGLKFEGVPVSHGFKVGIGSLLSTAMMEFFDEFTPDKGAVQKALKAHPSLEAKKERLKALFPENLHGPMLEVQEAKYPSLEALEQRLLMAKEVWPVIQEGFREQALPFDELMERLQAAGCPVTMEGIGLGPEAIEATMEKAAFLRHRYTVLDLTDDWNQRSEVSAYVLDKMGY